MPNTQYKNTVQLAKERSSKVPRDPSCPAPLDHAHLSRYTLSDKGLEIEVLRLFLAQIPLTIESLKFASMDQDWVVAAHTLKGSARAVGVRQLSELGLEAEQLGGIGDREACASLITRIERAATETEAYIKQHYAA